MNKLILRAIALALAANGSAGAADLTVPIKASAPMGYDWTGSYIGFHFGYGG